MNKAIIPAILLSVITTVAAFGQEMTRKPQEPTMKGPPMMKSVPMTKKAAEPVARAKKKRKPAKRYRKPTMKAMSRTK